MRLSASYYCLAHELLFSGTTILRGDYTLADSCGTSLEGFRDRSLYSSSESLAATWNLPDEIFEGYTAEFSPKTDDLETVRTFLAEWNKIRLNSAQP